jgi:spermidine/putrescine ABC transporter ATP-binding subunit
VVNAADLLVDRVTKTYGANTVLDDISISVQPGEFMTFLGPSGCGKTTLLRMLGGFAEPDQGRIVIAGKDVTSLPPNRRDCGFVFQSYALFPHMTVAANVGYGLKLRKTPKAELQKRVGEVLEIVGLSEFAGRYPRQMSGGQQQRVAIARAIAIRPSVLLLDEPLSNLDAKLRERIRFELRDLQKQLGITTVFVTHDQDEAMAVSDRIVVMSRGRLEQVGTPTEIYNAPASLFVADFVGINNILDGKMIDAAGSFARAETGFGVLEGIGADQAPGTAVKITLRPESIVVAQGTSNDGAGFPGTIQMAAFLGSTARNEIRLRDGSILKVAAPRGALLRPGSDVTCRWAPEDVRIVQ